MRLEARRLPGGGDQVVHECGADAVALAVEGDELHERDAEPLGEPSVDLSFDDGRVDADPAVIDRHHLADGDLTGPRVDVDDHDIDAEREGHVRRVVVGDTLEACLHPLGDVGVGGEGDVLDGLDLVGRPLHPEAAALELDIGEVGLEEMGGEGPRLVA